MAKRHKPDGTNQHPSEGSAAFPDSPSHGDKFESPNGLTYVYKAKDSDGNDIPGYWTMLGYPGPPGPQGPQGPGGLAGSYPTINETSGTWDLAHQEYDKDGNLVERKEPSNYPAQGTVRVLG